MGLTTSGNSGQRRQRAGGGGRAGMMTVALTGADGGKVADRGPDLPSGFRPTTPRDAGSVPAPGPHDLRDGRSSAIPQAY